MNICALQHHRVLNLFDSYTPCTMDTIATIARHHPYDIQILKYLPERDVSILSESEYRTLYDESITLEQRATRPTIGPRKVLPTRPYEELELGVEEWRKAALHSIDLCLSSFVNTTMLVTYKNHQTSPQKLPRCRHDFPAHRALQIFELLDNIIGYVIPASQYSAWHISSVWRRSVEYVLNSHYYVPYPCPPVEFRQHIDPKLECLQPLETQLARNEHNPKLFIEEAMNLGMSFLPVHITQARALPNTVRTAMDTIYLRDLLAPTGNTIAK
jgi:hypothetical protein